MSLTTHEKIRIEAGFHQRFTKESFLSEPIGGTVFYTRSDYPVKFVPEFGTGGTVAGVSDVQVWMGASGINGVSQMTVSEVDIDSGSVTLDTAPDTGCSLTVSYASSPITSRDTENVRKDAESMVNQRLSLCYDLPISPTPSVLTSMASRLSAALLLIRGYGVGSRDTSADGYALYEQLMGSGTQVKKGEEVERQDVGEVGMICTTGYQLVDDDGTIIVRNDEDTIEGSMDYKAGGRVGGRIFDVTEEPWRFKEPQADADTKQSGSGM